MKAEITYRVSYYEDRYESTIQYYLEKVTTPEIGDVWSITSIIAKFSNESEARIFVGHLKVSGFGIISVDESVLKKLKIP